MLDDKGDRVNLRINTTWFPVIRCWGLEIVYADTGARIFYRETTDPYGTLAEWARGRACEMPA